MPEIKKVGLSVVTLSAALAVSSCTTIPLIDGSPVSDNMKYRSNDASIKALSIPPELSKPAFDDSYSLNKPVDPAPVAQQASTSARVMQREPSTQDRINSQSAPTRSVTTTPVVQTPSAPPRAQPSVSSVSPRTQQPAVSSVSPRKQPSASPGTPSSASSRTQVALTKVKSGEPALAVNAPISTTWSRLAGMLPQVGFEVVKQQQKQGIYTVTAKSGSPFKQGTTYLVLLVGNASQQSFIGVRNSQGKVVDPAIATQVLGLLKGQYER